MVKKLHRDMDNIKTTQFELLNIKTLMYQIKNTVYEIKQIRSCRRKNYRT